MWIALPKHNEEKSSFTLLSEKTILTAIEIRRSLVRIAHEILERNGGVEEVVLVGMHTRGVPLAERLAAWIKEFENKDIAMGTLDIGLYRDDISKAHRAMRPTDIPVSIEGQIVVLVDDVLYTLSDREARVLQLRFGLEDGRSRTLEEGGRDFGVTRERIRQIEAKALRKLRHPSRSKKLKDFLE